MSKKINERLPQDSGKGSGLNAYYAIKSPWEKMYGFRDAMHYAARFEAVVSAACLQALRIIIPDYRERAQLMCEEAYARLVKTYGMYSKYSDDLLNIHPFMCGQFVGGLIGDQGDDALLMCGRCQDFGTYRAEKELDICDWDIVGSELCRATTMSLQGSADASAASRHPGPTIEFCMVEAKGCGDRHCRIVAENREKYPMPEHELWESFGPIATADQIKYTREEDCIKESMVFREECDYKFTNGTNQELESSSANMVKRSTAAATYILPAINEAVRREIVSRDMADHILRCVCEAAGKAMFGERYAIQAARDWLGVPREIDEDGRIAGGLIEMQLQSIMCEYEIEAFNENECIYVIDLPGLEMGGCKEVPKVHVDFWYGMVKTLVNAQWSLWEEDSPEGKLRIKIAKKIDKFC